MTDPKDHIPDHDLNEPEDAAEYDEMYNYDQIREDEDQEDYLHD